MSVVHSNVVIVGSGHAGAHAAAALRQLKYDGSILIVSKEVSLPYHRPPLSKDYLSGEKSFDRILLRPEAFWSSREIMLQLTTAVTRIDAVERSLYTHDDQVIQYDNLIWAAGGSPRCLTCAGAELDGVYSIRSREDIDRLRSKLEVIQRVVVIGGGYIGLEAASAFRKLGKSVTLLEALDRVLARVSGEALSSFYETQHREQGVDLRTGVTVECIEGDKHVHGVRLADGTLINADAVIVGVGINPSVEVLHAAGAEIGNGVNVDAFCRTNLPNVFAIGDCAAHLNRFANGSRIRLESVQNANDQAIVAAKAIMGAFSEYSATPWFWSDQYDLKLQTVGLASGHDDFIVRGDLKERSFSVVYLKSGRVIALDCVNSPKDFVQGKKLVEQGAIVPSDILRDSTIAINEFNSASRISL